MTKAFPLAANWSCVARLDSIPGLEVVRPMLLLTRVGADFRY